MALVDDGVEEGMTEPTTRPAAMPATAPPPPGAPASVRGRTSVLEIRILIGPTTDIYLRASDKEAAPAWRGKSFPPSETVVDILTAAFLGGDDPTAWPLLALP